MAEQTDSQRFPLVAAYGFLMAHGLGAEAEAIQQSQGRLGSYNSTIRRGRVIDVLERSNLLDEFIASEWPRGSTEQGRRELESCKRVYQRFLAQSPAADDSVVGDRAILSTPAQIARTSGSSIVLDAEDKEDIAPPFQAPATPGPDQTEPHDVRETTVRTQNDRHPPNVLDLLLEFWSAVFDIAVQIFFPDTARRPTRTPDEPEPAQQGPPYSPIKGRPTVQTGPTNDPCSGSKEAPVAPSADEERPLVSAVADEAPESLSRPALPDGVELRSGAITDDDKPSTIGADEKPVGVESPPSSETSVPAFLRDLGSSGLSPPTVEPPRVEGEANDLSNTAEIRPTTPDPGSLLLSPTPRATWIAPELRGGAPRGPRSTAPNRSATAAVERPQLVCARRGAAFHVGFEGASVVRAASGEALARDHGLQRVVELDSGFAWQSADRPPEAVRLPAVLVFQLSANAERGWQVSRAGAGINLLIAPNNYELLPAEGMTIVSRPAIGIVGHHAWEVQIEESATAISLSSTSGQIAVPVGRLEIVYDRSPVGVSDIGVPVFGPGPPLISLRDHRPTTLDCLVIGREDLAGQRKRERVDASEDLPERLGNVLRAAGFGWFFIRVYGREDNGTPTLESSTSFWYAPGLSSQTNCGSDPMPTYGKHEGIEIDVVHDGTIVCTEARPVANGHDIPDVLEITRTRQGSLVRVPGAIVCDGVDAILRSPEGSTLTLRIPIVRYWWAVTDDSAPQGEWFCTQVELPPSKFRAESPSRLHVRLPVWLPPRALQVQFRDAPVHNLKWQRNAAIASFRLGDLEGDMRSLKAAACDLFLIATDGAAEEDHTVAVRMVPTFACRLCDSGCDSQREADVHIRDAHIDVLRPRITEYTRIARAFNDQQGGERLPSKIHKCTLCTTYYPADDWQSKDGQGVRHMQTCPNLPKGTSDSAPFEIIKDIDKIRASSAKHLIERVGDAFGCKWCPDRVTFGEHAAEDHVFSDHRKLLYDAH